MEKDSAGQLQAGAPRHRSAIGILARWLRLGFGVLLTVPGAILAATPTQLPRNARPVHYEVQIAADAATLTFHGRVGITLELLSASRSITLNALGLQFTGAHLAGPGAADLADPRVEPDEASQTATLHFARSMARGRYRLDLEYDGRIGTQPVGLFALDYDTVEGHQRALFTQFENSDARRMIPSWDEPAYRASFALEVIAPQRDQLVSNMPVASRVELGDGRIRVRFATTPPMATYLLFLAEGDLERLTGTVDGTEVGVVARHGAASQGRFALDAAKSILHEYNDYFGVPYPLPKLDNVGAPGRSQFFGAMENWGAIFTFEYALLLEPSIATQADVEKVFALEAHEMAHMWFGDLVTMSWWDDLWLNEGFASWMESRTTARLHPEWHSSLDAIAVRQRAMERDALATTHPIVQRIATAQQASQAFDSITYSKGEAVIRMLEGYVGADAWRDGIRRYIKAHAYGSTVSADLWRAVERTTGTRITPIAEAFTLQAGVPLISVAGSDCEGNRRSLQLTQDEFSLGPLGRAPQRWPVPVIYSALGSGAALRTLVSGGGTRLQVASCEPVIVNAGQSGYYRTLYSPRDFQAIVGAFAALAPIDQLGVVADSWSLGMVGLQPASDFLALVDAAPATADAHLWRDLARMLRGTDEYYAATDPGRAAFRRFANARLQPVFATVGWTERAGEPSSTTNLRVELIDALSALGDGGVIGEARRRYFGQAADGSLVPAKLRKSIVTAVARHADLASWQQLQTAARQERSPLVKDFLYRALAMAESEPLARRALALALTDEPGATICADMIRIVADLHAELAFDFALANLATVLTKVDEMSARRFVPALGTMSRDAAIAGRIRDYARQHLPADARRDAETTAATVDFRGQVRKLRLPQIDRWLTERP